MIHLSVTMENISSSVQGAVQPCMEEVILKWHAFRNLKPR